MSKKTEDEYKICPLLEARGVSPEKIPRRVSALDDSWLNVCIKECPIDVCIFFDVLTTEEKGKLQKEAKKWEKTNSP